jgi:hypothetical protein
MQRMNAFNPTFGTVHVQPTMPKINLRPTKLTELGSTKAMSIR